MKNGLLLWADDEMDLLRPHVLFLENKGYEVVTVTNGQDALDMCREQTFDLIMLDENMPGLSGLETLARIKEIAPSVPVVMVTKSEEENIMEQAIGSKIADYLIKPVNPHQILMTLKKNIHQRDILSEKTDTNYQQNFARLGMQIDNASSVEEWMEVYRQLVSWELQLAEAGSNMVEMLQMQTTVENATPGKI
jgi:DNA-binding response OmpR family regulator